jgi:hypothetical protein
MQWFISEDGWTSLGFRARYDVELVQSPGGEHVGCQSLPVQLSRVPYAVDNYGTIRMFSWARVMR